MLSSLLRSNTNVRWLIAVNHSVPVMQRASMSIWKHLGEAPLDSNHATNAAFEADQSPLKVNLGRGVYKDDAGKNWILPSVRLADQQIALASQGQGPKSLAGHDYLPFDGLKDFVSATSSFAFGEHSPLIQNKRVATVQTLSGTGALRVGGEFLARFLPSDVDRVMYVSSPTYVNHFPVFELSGFKIKDYPYYDANTRALNVSGFLNAAKEAPKKSVFLLHACAHNPTGVDPSKEQWDQLLEIFLERGHIGFFDSAYQGFASGDADRDAYSFRKFAEAGVPTVVAQSYAKNFGLYGQRIGALNVVSASTDETPRVKSHLNKVIRPMYSNPPLHGARIVSTVFNDPELRSQWKKDVKTMADRIIGARKALVTKLGELGSKRDWQHITNQIGMFAYSGLSEDEVRRLRDLHVYMNLDGRMSISGINSGNVEYLAQAMHKATSQ